MYNTTSPFDRAFIFAEQIRDVADALQEMHGESVDGLLSLTNIIKEKAQAIDEALAEAAKGP